MAAAVTSHAAFKDIGASTFVRPVVDACDSAEMSVERVEIRDEDFLVHVKAQVMVRDDSKGGWVPRGAGGMSIVGLCQLPAATSTGTGRDVIGTGTLLEFLIYGRRIADRSVVLNCTVHKDLQYTRANPTFHHWKTEGKRFGLTFQSSTEARLFEKAIRRAVENIREGHVNKMPANLKVEIEGILAKHCSLSFDRKDSISRPESTASTTVSTPSAQSPTSPSSAPPFTFYPDFSNNSSPPIIHQPPTISKASSTSRVLPAFLLRTPRRPAVTDERRKLTNGSSTSGSSSSTKTPSTASGTAVGENECDVSGGVARDPPWYRTFPPFTSPSGRLSSATGWLSWPTIGLPQPSKNADAASSFRKEKDVPTSGKSARSSSGLQIEHSPVVSLGAYALSGTTTNAASCAMMSVDSQEEYVHFAATSSTGTGPAGLVGRSVTSSKDSSVGAVTVGGFEYSYPQLEYVTPLSLAKSSSSTSSSSSSRHSLFPADPASSNAGVDQGRPRRNHHRHRQHHVPKLPLHETSSNASAVPPKSSLSMTSFAASTASMPPLPPPPAPPRVVVCRPAVAVDDRPSQQLLSRTARCVYCQKPFDVRANGPGSCREAPRGSSSVEFAYRAVDCLSCGDCARFVLRHCCRPVDPPSLGPTPSPTPWIATTATSFDVENDDDDGNVKVHPCVWLCACGGPTTRLTGSERSDDCCRRWAALGALSIVMPCVWCYWPLTACSRGTVCCHRNHQGESGGGRHRAI